MPCSLHQQALTGPAEDPAAKRRKVVEIHNGSKRMPMSDREQFLLRHEQSARRYFLRLGVAGSAAWSFRPSTAGADPPAPRLAKALETLEPFFTPQEKFRDVSRGKPLPHSLPDEKKRDAGLTRETWKLEVVSDPDNPATIRRPLTQKDGTALDFA